MDTHEKDMDLAILKEKIGGMEGLHELKYASSKDFSDIKTRLTVCEQDVKNLGRRFDDDIISRRYMTATNISIVSLIIAIIMAAVTIVAKFIH